MKKILSNSLLILLAILLVLVIKGTWQLKDRHPDLSDELNSIYSEGHIKVGAASLSIVPKYFETWIGKNENAQFDASIDEFNDANKNGKFDAIWMAGFQPRRPIKEVHDSIWAAAMVIEVAGKSIGFLSLDVIGLGNDHCWEIRKKVREKTGLSQLYVVSTHNHQGPDIIGLWGPKQFSSGVNQNYLDFLIAQSVRSVEFVCLPTAHRTKIES